MSNYSKLAVHDVNKWVWDNLKRDLPIEFEAYLTAGSPVNGLRPIIPSQQVPELNNVEGGAPYIVYTYTLTGAADSWWMLADNIVYTIYDNDEARLRRIQNYLNHLLRRIDHTAEEINAFLGDSEFDIKFIAVTGGSGPDPFTAEGGRQAVMLTFRIEYTVDINGQVASLSGLPAGMRT